jgi:hypothetical protein
MDAALVLYRRPNEEVEPVRIAAVNCLIDLGETAEGVAAQVLKSSIFDCVVTGAGLRQPPSQLLLFEKIINLVHTLAPTAGGHPGGCATLDPRDVAGARGSGMLGRWLES